MTLSELRQAKNKLDELKQIAREIKELNIPQLNEVWEQAENYEDIKDKLHALYLQMVSEENEDSKTGFANKFDVSSAGSLKYDFMKESENGKGFERIVKYEVTALDELHSLENIFYYINNNLLFDDVLLRITTPAMISYAHSVYMNKEQGQPVIPLSACEEEWDDSSKYEYLTNGQY